MTLAPSVNLCSARSLSFSMWCPAHRPQQQQQCPHVNQAISLVDAALSSVIGCCSSSATWHALSKELLKIATYRLFVGKHVNSRRQQSAVFRDCPAPLKSLHTCQNTASFGNLVTPSPAARCIPAPTTTPKAPLDERNPAACAQEEDFDLALLQLQKASSPCLVAAPVKLSCLGSREAGIAVVE